MHAADPCVFEYEVDTKILKKGHLPWKFKCSGGDSYLEA